MPVPFLCPVIRPPLGERPDGLARKAAPIGPATLMLAASLTWLGCGVSSEDPNFGSGGIDGLTSSHAEGSTG